MTCLLCRIFLSLTLKKSGYTGFFVIFFTLILNSSLSAFNDGKSNVSSSNFDYQIGTWKGFKTAAMTFSFDDNYRFQVTLARPILNEHNYKATYFWVTNRVGKGWAPGWDTANMMAAEGHEIASHSKNHPDMLTLALNSKWDSIKHELKDSRDTINARVPSQHCETFAWPSGACNADLIDTAKNYYMTCRGTSNYCNMYEPDDFYNLYSQHIYHDTPLEEVNQFIDNAIGYRGWLIERWHGFRNMHDTNGYEPVPIGEFHCHVDYVAEHEKDLWISTIDSVVKYIRERDISTLALIDSNSYQVTTSLTNYLPDNVFHYKVPLSLRVMIYPNMTNVYLIMQGTRVLPFFVTLDVNGSHWLNFDAIPNDSLIVMHMAPVGIPDLSGLTNGAKNYPNPFNSQTTIEFYLPEGEHADIKIYDIYSRQVADLSNEFHAGRNTIDFYRGGLRSGLYSCVITIPGKQLKIKMSIL